MCLWGYPLQKQVARCLINHLLCLLMLVSIVKIVFSIVISLMRFNLPSIIVVFVIELAQPVVRTFWPTQWLSVSTPILHQDQYHQQNSSP